jgi:alanyl-tRNA synthetase
VVEQAPANEQSIIITDVTPFYVECGGQTSDAGFVEIGNVRCPVIKLHKFDHAIGLEIKPGVPVSINQVVTLYVDQQTRLNIMKNHTATHLLQAALVEMLGASVKQAGSLVTPEYLRFDFNTTDTLTPEQIGALEKRVNEKIMENIPVSTRTTTYKDAVEHGVTAIFGEKYNPESVRVVAVPGFSAELCGGTHVRATGDIGVFKITEFSAVSAGVKRIVALTGPEAVALFQLTHMVVKTLGQEFKVKPAEVLDAVKKQRDQLKDAGNQIKQLKKKLWSLSSDTLLEHMHMINGVPVLYHELEDATGEDLKEVCTLLLSKKPGFYFLTAPSAQRTGFYGQVAKEFAGKLNCVELLTWLKEQGFNGGGSATMIQGSTTQSVQGFGDILEAQLKKMIK